MRDKLGLSIFLLFMLFTFGCLASSVNELSKNYKESMQAVQQFADVTAEDWEFGMGMIFGLVPEKELPQWFIDEDKKVSKWIKEAGGTAKLDKRKRGYLLTLRARMGGPTLEAVIKKYVPQLLNVREVISVLAFFGLGG